MARQYTAMVQFRTTLDQAGRIAGLAGELNVTESEVTRALVDRALEGPRRDLLRWLRRELQPPREATDTEIAEHLERQHRGS